MEIHDRESEHTSSLKVRRFLPSGSIRAKQMIKRILSFSACQYTARLNTATSLCEQQPIKKDKLLHLAGLHEDIAILHFPKA
jgi:hypothetical protein